MFVVLAMYLNEAKANNPQLDECIDKCNATIQSAQKYIRDLEEVNTLQYDLINKQNNKIARLEDEASRWYRNPVVIFFTGLSVGIMLNQRAGK